MATNYEKLQSELKVLKNQTSSLSWALDILKGDYVGDVNVVVGVKQGTSTCAVHEGCILNKGSVISEELTIVLQKHQDKALNRVSEIESILKSIDNLLEGK